MKKFIALFLVLSFFNFSFLPVYASSKTKVETVIISNINANKTQNDEIVKFVSTQDIKNYDGNIIPQGTVFTGKINSIEKSRGAYKRAKISINIYEMTLPNGEHYNIKASTKNKFLKGSAFGNIAKGFCTTPIALSVGCLGSIAILFECISVVGLIAVVPTGNFFGRAMGKITKGLNCKKHKGDVIAILVDNANFTTDNNIYINNKTNHNEQNTSYDGQDYQDDNYSDEQNTSYDEQDYQDDNYSDEQNTSYDGQDYQDDNYSDEQNTSYDGQNYQDDNYYDKPIQQGDYIIEKSPYTFKE